MERKGRRRGGEKQQEEAERSRREGETIGKERYEYVDEAEDEKTI